MQAERTADHWLEASVRVPRSMAGQVESLMTSQGALAVTLTDCGDMAVLEPGVGETPLWGMVQLTGLFPGDTPGAQLAAVLSLAPGVGRPERVSFQRVEDRAWARAWLDGFEPMRFGSGLWIVPTAHDAPDPEAVIVRLDPGLAFGTGAHATTRLCLEWIDRQECSGLSVIDYGCGSGVLGIAAALKGAKKVWCVDNDPQALTATAINARRNGVADRIETVHSDEFSAPPADIVLANILAGTLVGLAPQLCDAVMPGGRIALSGILAEQAGEVAGAYTGRMNQMQASTLDDWVLLTADKAKIDA